MNNCCVIGILTKSTLYSTTKNGLTTTEKNAILPEQLLDFNQKRAKKGKEGQKRAKRGKKGQKMAKKGDFFGQKCSKMLKKSPDINFSYFSWKLKPLSLSLPL